MMTPRRVPYPRHVRYSVRHQARLDEETHVKLEELTAAFRRKRAAILRYIMQWGITHSKGWTIDQSISASTHPVPLLLEPELAQQVCHAAAIHGVSIAAWLRHAVRQITRDDFPTSWHTQETFVRSHDSGYYIRRFMLRLDEETSHK
jgi:hypothetical protein